VGIALLATGAVTLIALALPGQGRLTDLWRDWIAPWFGTGRWLLPFVLLAAGIYVERVRTRPGDWEQRLLGAAIAFVATLGLIELIDNRLSGGRIGIFLADVLGNLVTRPGAFIVLIGIALGGLLIMADMGLGDFLAPLRRGAGSLRAALQAAPEGDQEPPAAKDRRMKSPVPVMGEDAAAEPRNGGRNGGPREIIPEAVPSAAPISATFAARLDPLGTSARGLTAVALAPAGAATASATATALDEDVEQPGQADSEINWKLPSIDLLEQTAINPTPAGEEAMHRRNEEIITKKLRSFGIDAAVVGRNAGPVVTQYEVQPAPDVKVSRIEALADDLAMALAARSLRIEAPIPGKSAVGIEVPNTQSEIVGFRSLIEDADMLETSSRLTFALGRDVSGKAYAVDLAKMPHLLIAGATGSGKSVCVNALITSLLMHARPTDVKLILIDLKRVELAPYDGLPHLKQHVIVEPHEAKAALNWAVHEMEDRYKKLASATVRNLNGYNDKVGPHDRLPYVVLIIDELADLIMREGRKVEDSVVKVAQKARAVGIHLVLATQRPSVNVVTGLIKANVPSRIAFAMASMVDSRTVLDQPGAEDLIGRGDMLYQPVDLPRPIRMQGVFVSDREVTAVADFWRRQLPDGPNYDEAVLAYVGDDDGGGGAGGQFGWLAKIADDEMAVRAAEVVTLAGRASTSMLQTKLKVGFNRASRLIEILERYGVVAPQDPRSPAAFRQVYGPDNWLRTLDDVDRDD
jgi:DNA segregation ATPase FtsK/SpoIIIE-like protein